MSTNDYKVSANIITPDIAHTDLSNLSDTGKNIGNWSNNVTNCLIKIPQDIKIELNNGTLTLKASSKVYAPNGFESDGTTPKFDAYTISSDITKTLNTNDIRSFYLTSDKSAVLGLVNSVLFSGDTAPTNFGQWALWYDTANNLIKYTQNSGSTWVSGGSFPLFIATSDATQIVSIDQTFNGFGYIGNTVFALPGVEGLIPNGRNDDGTLKNTVASISDVKKYTIPSGSSSTVSMLFANEGVFPSNNTFYYNEDDNINLQNGNKLSYAEVGTLSFDATGKITSLTPKTSIHCVGYSEFDAVEGRLSSVENNYVATNTNQTITGIKTFSTTGALQAKDPVLLKQNTTNEGGQIYFQRSDTSVLASDPYIDLNTNSIRVIGTSSQNVLHDTLKVDLENSVVNMTSANISRPGDYASMFLRGNKTLAQTGGTHTAQMIIRDVNDKTAGFLQNIRYAAGYTTTDIGSYDSAGSSLSILRLYKYNNGTSYAECPTPTDTTSTSSQQIATVGWSNTNLSRTDLSNSPYTTNRILEIPQDVKLELSNGTLTIKAGTKYYIPDGFESDGTTPKFRTVTLSSDSTLTSTYSNIPRFLMSTGGLLSTDFDISPISACYSGATAPTGFSGNAAWWYDTTNNVIKLTLNSGSTWSTGTGLSLPLAIVHTAGLNTQIEAIDQIFNGFGYIGSTTFVLPNCKWAYPAGKNSDGTNKFSIHSNPSVLTMNHGSVSSLHYIGILDGGGITRLTQSDYRYDADKNMYFNSGSNKYQSLLPIILERTESGRVVDFQMYSVDSVANSNMTNISSAGMSYLAGLSTPAGYKELTLLASGSSYTAPANGWFRVVGNPSAGTTMALYSAYLAPKEKNNGNSPMDAELLVRVSKGESVTYNYTGSFYSTNRIFFVYDRGDV